MATTNSTPRSLVSLALPRPTAALLTYAAQIVKASTNNPLLPNPSPTIAALTQAIADLQAAEAAALSRQKGAVLARNDKRAALVQLPELFKAYVQSVADTNNDTVATVITTWILLPSSVQAKTSISGLVAGSTVMFRYRTVTKTGVSDWLAPLSFFVN